MEENGCDLLANRALKVEQTAARRPIRLPAGARAGAAAVAQARIEIARRSFVTRRADLGEVARLIEAAVPRAGDLVLARVGTLGHHRRLQLSSGRRSWLFPDDEIIVAYGHRYAPQQFEALVPHSLAPCHLVAAGGIAAHAVGWHQRILAPTEIEPVGLLARADGSRLNLRDWAIPRPSRVSLCPPIVIAITGTSMDSGKTTSGAHLVRGLRLADYSVGTAKLTGTGACNDVDWMRDAGARAVLDFTDAGYASTHRLATSELIEIGEHLLDHLAQSSVDVAVVEIADGLGQPETAALLDSDWARAVFDGVVFCAGDALGACAGREWLKQRGHRVLCISGLLTSAPLLIRETSSLAPNVPVLDLAALSDPRTVSRLISHRSAALV